MIDRHGGPIVRLRWGDTVSRSAPHPLSRSSLEWIFRPVKLPADGGDHCICACTDATTPSLRMAVSPGCEEDGLFAMPGGQSESPLSRHSRDQHRLWMVGLASPFRERSGDLAADSRGGDLRL
jgi:penicillin amidase